MWRADSLDSPDWNFPDAGKDWGQEQGGVAEDSITDSLGMSLRKLQDPVKDRDAWCATVHAVAKSLTQLSKRTATTIIKNVSDVNF